MKPAVADVIAQVQVRPADLRLQAKPENYSPETQLQSAMRNESNRRMRKLPNGVFDGRKSRRVMLK